MLLALGSTRWHAAAALMQANTPLNKRATELASWKGLMRPIEKIV